MNGRDALKLGVLLGALGLAGHSDAHANQIQDRQIDRALTQARSAWPDSPCQGRERIMWDTKLARTFGKDTIAGAWMDGSCRIVLSNSLAHANRRTFCLILTHELGHLAGYNHVEGAGAKSPLGAMAKYMQDLKWNGCK